MAGLLAVGEVLRAVPSGDVKVLSFIAEGGQGEVYRVESPSGEKALKWYFAHTATAEQRVILEKLVGNDQNDPRFLWPQAIVVLSRMPGQFGYLMPLRPSHFASLPDLFRRQVSDATFRSLTSACIHLVEAFRSLHARGMAYRDINWGNVFFDPVNGDILVCDNDNAIFEGHSTGVGGTMEFMAPELVRDEGVPRTQTDLHSLAVLLFLMLVNHHPLQGAREHKIHCMDASAKADLYGAHPVFVFDPNDDSNRPVHGVQDTADALWKLLPTAARDLFVKAFTDGLHDPDNGRVRETQWRDVLSRMRDQIVVCGRCLKQNFHDMDAYVRTRATGPCWGCKLPLLLPPRMKLSTGAVIMLNAGATIHPHHLDPSRPHDFKTIVGEVSQHPTNPNLFGLTNRSGQAWTLLEADGTTRTLDPGRSTSLVDGRSLRMGSVQADVRTAGG